MNQVHKEPVYILIPVHNRKNITLKCLNHLNQQGDLKHYYVVVIDDGSTDGTSEAITSLYPEVVILKGDGNLWWTGAIKKGMQYVYEKGANYFIWLNDDCYPQPGAIDKLLELCQSEPNLIVGGQSLDPDTLIPTYGGVIRKITKVLPVNTINFNTLVCDGLAGNFVCFPCQVVEDIGYPNENLFPQYYGDVVYTHYAKKNQYKLLIDAKAIAFCKNDHPVVSWLTSDCSLLTYLQAYFQIKSSFYWKAEFNYYREMLGIVGIGIYLYQRIFKLSFFCILSFIIPLKVRKKLKILYQYLLNTNLAIAE